MKAFCTLLLFFLTLNVFPQQPLIQFWRPHDKTGINMFEPGKADTVRYKGLKIRWGANFTQQFQALDHSNTALPKYDADSNNVNQLIELGAGFNLATANLNMDVQLEDGIRLNLVTYLSSRHHPDAWVKGGFVQIDRVTFLDSPLLDKVMRFVTIKVGHYEVNYGDAHFRRTDNGNAFYNPFAGNYIMDAFTTEIGAEAYFRYKTFFAMAGSTNGENKGDVTNPDRRMPSWLGKLGYDQQVTEKLRLRITASGYTTGGSVNNTLYGGDRTGSRYYLVMENFMANTEDNFTSGRFNPGFSDKITAAVINPFIKFKGVELFGNFERAVGKSSAEENERTWYQLAGDLIFRFGRNENFYVAARYNQVKGMLSGYGTKASIKRIQAATGMYITRNILLKVEYVDQEYNNFPGLDIRNGGEFHGIIAEGVIAF